MTAGLLWADEVPSLDDYFALREATGLGAFPAEAARIGLAATLCAVSARDGDGRLVAMARLIGDGGCFAQVTDVAVHPDLQGQGIGTQVMKRLMARAKERLPKGCYVSLIADPGAERLYARFGFTDRHGMAVTL